MMVKVIAITMIKKVRDHLITYISMAGMENCQDLIKQKGKRKKNDKFEREVGMF